MNFGNKHLTVCCRAENGSLYTRLACELLPVFSRGGHCREFLGCFRVSSMSRWVARCVSASFLAGQREELQVCGSARVHGTQPLSRELSKHRSGPTHAFAGSVPPEGRKQHPSSKHMQPRPWPLTAAPGMGSEPTWLPPSPGPGECTGRAGGSGTSPHVESDAFSKAVAMGCPSNNKIGQTEDLITVVCNPRSNPQQPINRRTFT